MTTCRCGRGISGIVCEGLVGVVCVFVLGMWKVVTYRELSLGRKWRLFFFFFVLIKEESSASEETAGESRQSGRKPDTAPVIQQYSLPDAVVANDSVR